MSEVPIVIDPSSITHESLVALLSRWQDPVTFARGGFLHSPASSFPVAIDPQQARILRAVSEHDRVAVRTGRGIGKTAAAAIISLWWLTTRKPALVVTSAGTWGHLEDKLWPEIRIWARQWLLSEAYEHQQLGIYHLEEPDLARIVATSSDNPANVEGYHSPHFLLIIDEAKGMPDEIFDALLASMTGLVEEGGEQKIVALSTPPLSKAGWFARISAGSEWHVVHVSGIDSPRVSRAYIAEIHDTYGEDSPEYQAFVLGNIPEFTIETVVPLVWFEACQALAPCSPRKTTRRPVLTCDVAREGDDLSVFGLLDRAAFDLVRFEDRPGWLSHATVPQVIGRCVQALRLHPRAAAYCIDDTGLGGGVTDGLREHQYLKTKHADGTLYVPETCSILGVKFGSKPSREDRFNHKKDELWWSAREAIRERKLALPDDETIRSWHCPRGTDFKTQVTSAIYEYVGEDKIDVLDKRTAGKERTRSLPTKSPDIAHALILGLRYYMRQTERDADETPDPEEMTQSSLLHAKVQEAVRTTIRDAGSSAYSNDPYRRRR